MPAAQSAPPPGSPVAEHGAGAAVQALVPAPKPQQKPEKVIFPEPLPQLPVELAVSVPVRDFRVRQLLVLAPGDVIETQWSHGDDLPLAAGNVHLAWSEFEVVETQLAVRITRLE